jgi:hypothetical protein
MRELHGVTALLPDRPVPLKQQALFCDELHLVRPDPRYGREYRDVLEQQAAECDFLEAQGLVKFISREKFEDAISMHAVKTREDLASSMRTWARNQYEQFRDRIRKQEADEVWSDYNRTLAGRPITNLDVSFSDDRFFDVCVRLLAEGLANQPAATEHSAVVDVVPLCWFALGLPIGASRTSESPAVNVFQLGLEVLPVPGDDCAWEDILAFRAEAKQKQWAFRRFLGSLASKKQSEAEVRDDLEWTLNEYEREMDRFKLKRSVSFMETYVIPTVEAFESFKPSSFLKGLVSIKKRKIELLEGEANAKGRECAYVFDARKKFGPVN